MPKKVKEKSATEVRRLARPGRHCVGGVAGLQLLVTEKGTRSWVLRALVGQKRRDIGLGAYPDVTLAHARERARELRIQIRQGIDPIAEKKAAITALMADQAKELLFDDAARRCHQVKAPEFRNEKHSQQWLASLERYASPVIGRMPVQDVQLPHVLQVLDPIWKTKTETASRVRQRIEAVLTWASVSGFRTGENPARWEGNLREVLATPSKMRRVKHHRALPYPEMGAFMAELRTRTGAAARALEFQILTAARSGEVRGMTWDEIDMDSKVWTVPADRIKAGKRHQVPLSADAMKLLKSAVCYEGCPYVFPAPRGGRLSDMSLLAVLKRMQVDAVPHGFRSTFKDWARSCTSYPDEVSELALAHVSTDATRAAYARDELLPKRKRLMNDWARYCKILQKSGEVVAIRGKQ